MMSNGIAVIAHRGASGLAGEDNTLKSFALAIELRCDYAEFDVRQTRDELVCFHDGRLGRTPVADLTLAELRERTGVAVPTLREVLEFCRGRIGLDVEIKDPGTEADVVAALRAVRRDTPVMIKSFHHEVVARLSAMAPPYPVGLLVGKPPAAPRVKTLLAAATACEELGASFLSPHCGLLVNTPAVRVVLGVLPTYPWTVNHPVTMSRLCAMPIRGLITDRPDLLLKALGRAS